MLKFKLINQDKVTKARAGEIETSHGIIQTPIFMPVGTVGTVKAVQQKDLSDDIKAQIILGNTYHLYLRPGTKILEQAGGLHQFMNWQKPMLTDSGGYQVYSLSSSRKISEEGVKFASHIDGSHHFFSPESAIDIQRSIGADIIMAFDECAPYPCEYNYARKSVDMTHRWLKRCMKRMDETTPKYGHFQTLFPIVQGGTYKDLRIKSAEFISEQNAGGNAIGGLSVGEPDDEMYEMTDLVCSILPSDKPRYLMGVGTPVNLLENIALGVDMFDCVMPTRNARNGMLFTWEGVINIKNKKWESDFSALDPKGKSYVDQFYSKAYLRHLFVSGERLAAQIASMHNLAFYLDLVQLAREQIILGNFSEWKKVMVQKLSFKL
jgi:queuine tRNA-ribosyltransferase